MTSNTISIFIESQFNDRFRQDGPLLVQFIKYYYEWLEQYENPVYVSRKIREYRDVDKIPEKFFQFMREEFLKNIPITIVDERLLLKNILNFYRARGTEKAYQLLFRIMYGEEISFYYPGKDILRASDGRWVIDRSLKLRLLVPTDGIQAMTIFEGISSKASARVERFLSYTSSGATVNELYYTHKFGDFVVNETIKDSNTGDEVALITAIITHDGRYEGTNGFLSWDKFLQDNFYYQEYSYQINSSRSLVDYQHVAYDLLHPAGTKLFGGVVVVSEIDFSAFSGLKVNSSSANVQDEEFLTVNYEFIVSGQNTQLLANTSLLFVANNSIAGTQETLTMEAVKLWYDAKFTTLASLDFVDMEQVTWLKSSGAHFTFADNYVLEIKDTTNNDTVYEFADVVVNTSIIYLRGEYPYGITTGLTSKYHVLPGTAVGVSASAISQSQAFGTATVA